MPKNIIICCDGTNNKFGANNSNVVHLFSVLDNQFEKQIAYYDPGVGTLADTGLFGPINKNLSIILGSAFGRGMQKNVEEAYIYLMEKYEDGDKIYLFGFSRGAYTVRVLAGFIKMLGLLEKGNRNLIPYAYEIYSDKKMPGGKKFEIAGKFKYNYGRQIKNPDFDPDDHKSKTHTHDIKIHFMGLWDTVSSVGWVGNLHSYPYTSNNNNIVTIRHALAIDERRTYFMNETLGKKEDDKIGDDKKTEQKTNIKEVWFCGVHSDVGGSYAPIKSGLSKIALDWMVHEASLAGVQFNESRYKYVVHHPKPKTKNGPAEDSPPDHNGFKHESLTGFWKIAEIIPRTIIVGYKKVKDAKDAIKTKKITKTFIPMGRPRIIPEGSIIHQSVKDRMEEKEEEKLKYEPKNVSLLSCTVEQYQLPFLSEEDKIILLKWPDSSTPPSRHLFEEWKSSLKKNG